MKLILQNIGILNFAEVEFAGLTIVGGLNDTGKSTVGKVMFVITHALQKCKNDFLQSRRNTIYKEIRELHEFAKKIPSFLNSLFTEDKLTEDMTEFISNLDFDKEMLRSYVETNTKKLIKELPQTNLYKDTLDQEIKKHIHKLSGFISTGVPESVETFFDLENLKKQTYEIINHSDAGISDFFSELEKQVTNLMQAMPQTEYFRMLKLKEQLSENEALNKIETDIHEAITEFKRIFAKQNEKPSHRDELKKQLSEEITEKFKHFFDAFVADYINWDKTRNIFEKFLVAVFRNDLRPRNATRSTVSSIQVEKDGNNILTIKIKVGNEIEIDFQKEIFSVFFDDCTLIENYSVLMKNDFASEYLDAAFSGEFNVPMQDADLHKKLTKNITKREITFFDDKLFKNLDGEVFYDHNAKEFLFEKKGQRFSMFNTASGIKSMGVLQILSKAGFFKQKSLIIIDEPENHLHPEWQLLLSEIICKLHKETDVFFLVNTHSVYMLEALDTLSKQTIPNAAYFCLAKKDGNSTIITDITENTEPFYQQMAAPMQKLFFIS